MAETKEIKPSAFVIMPITNASLSRRLTRIALGYTARGCPVQLYLIGNPNLKGDLQWVL